MKHIKVGRRRRLFEPLLASTSVQAASMVLPPGQASGDKIENEHPRAEQWLFVIDGSGRADFSRRSVGLRAGSLLLIEKNEAHRIVNTGRTTMHTINFYAPPAYDNAGEVRRGAMRRMA